MVSVLVSLGSDCVGVEMVGVLGVVGWVCSVLCSLFSVLFLRAAFAASGTERLDVGYLCVDCVCAGTVFMRGLWRNRL